MYLYFASVTTSVLVDFSNILTLWYVLFFTLLFTFEHLQILYAALY